MTLLSVNLNKIALIRNSRGGLLPDPLQAGRVALAAGCGGITLHPRPDLRHALPADAHAARILCRGAELNLEGNPYSQATAHYPGFLELLEACLPDQATLVPDGDSQLTSDHGWGLSAEQSRLRPMVARLRGLGIRVSLFMDVDSPDIERAADIGADRIEIFTGPYAHARDSAALDACARTAERAAKVGLGVNAGHDLDQCNLGPLLRHVPKIREVSIGHALINEALYDGLAMTVKRYLGVIQEAHVQR